MQCKSFYNPFIHVSVPVPEPSQLVLGNVKQTVPLTIRCHWGQVWRPIHTDQKRERKDQRQECIPVGCVPPAHWSYLRISSYPTHTPPPPTPIPGATMHPPRSNHASPPEQPCTPPPRATTHAPPPEQPRTPPSVNRMTNRCKNITLPQTSFAGGKNVRFRLVWMELQTKDVGEGRFRCVFLIYESLPQKYLLLRFKNNKWIVLWSFLDVSCDKISSYFLPSDATIIATAATGYYFCLSTSKITDSWQNIYFVLARGTIV